MARGVNKVILVGNLGRDPEIRSMQDGGRVANLSLATSETWRDKNSGERRERTEWHRVVIFNDRLVDVIDLLLATPTPEEPITLMRPKVLYEYSLEELEELSAGQKLLLRMGSEHAATIKEVLREFRAQIATQ